MATTDSVTGDAAAANKILEGSSTSAQPLVVGGADEDDVAVDGSCSNQVWQGDGGAFPQSFLGYPVPLDEHAPPPGYLTHEDLFAPKTIRPDEILAGLEKMSGGGLKCVDKEALKKQKGVIMDMLKQVGSNMLEGKNVVNISLPVRIFEPRSLLERICDWWAFAPTYLTRASQTTDPLERMKLVVAFAISGLYLTSKQEKPFNPILGETYQATYSDGSEISCEHTSHHPPISNFQVLGPQSAWNFWGFYSYSAAMKGNSVVGGQDGPNHCEFPDGHRITFYLGQMRLGGIMFGDRTVQWEGTVRFEDNKHGLQCELHFDPGAKKGFFSRRTGKSDDFAGEIFRVPAGATSDGHKKKEPKEREVLSTVSGSWLEHCDIDGVRYWEITRDSPFRPIPTKQPLDSDCRFREDLIWTKRGDLKKAQVWKVRLEVRQRADKKLRLDASKHHGHGSAHGHGHSR